VALPSGDELLRPRDGARSGATKGEGVAANDRWVVEYPEGGWAVERENRERVSDVLGTQQEAIERGREIVRNLGGGELLVKGRDGQIRDKVTVAPG
jgi:hypothetical protein